MPWTVYRELNKFQGLRSCFSSEGISDAVTGFYLQVSPASSVTFISFKKFLQWEDPSIYLQHFQSNE